MKVEHPVAEHGAEALLQQIIESPDPTTLPLLLQAHPPENQLKLLESWRQIAASYAFSGDATRANTIARLVEDASRLMGSPEAQAQAAWAYGNVSAIMGQAREAVVHFHQAEEHYLSLGDKLNLARMQVGLVGALNRLGEFTEASHVAQAAYHTLSASHEPTDRQRLAGLANNLAIAYEYQGRYQEAIELYERKIALWHNHPNQRQALIEIARTRLNLGIIKKHLNLWHEADSSLTDCQRILTAPALAGQYRPDLARASVHLAHLRSKQGASATAVKAAFTTAREIVSDPQNLLLLTLYEVEWVLNSNQLSPPFLAMLQELHQRYTEDGYMREAIRVDLAIAHCQAEMGRGAAARLKFAEAQQAAQTIQDWELQYMAWHGLGLLNLKSGQYQQAEVALLKAVDMVENVSQSMKSGDLRAGFLDDKLAVYRDLAWLHLLKDDMPQLFHWSERGRTRELVNALALDEPGETALWPADQGQLRPFIEQLRHQLKTEQHGERRRQLEDRLIELTRRHEQQTFHKVAHLTHVTATLNDASAALPPDTLMLVYFAANRELWVLPITTQATLPAVKLGAALKLDDVERQLASLHSLKGYPLAWVDRHSEQLTADAQRLLGCWYDCFLSPLASLLAQFSRLLIVLDDFLFRLPMHAFYDTVNGRYLAQTHEVSYTPSVTAWLAANNRPTSQGNGLILSYAGSQLHHTTDELKAIRAAYPDFAAYEGQSASRQVLETPLAQESAVIHIAAHAIFRPDNPMFSYIELADDRLNMLDILQLKLKANLVVLSACESGRGLLRGGDYLCLPHAFLMAGSRLVLASHWPVDDLATSILMGEFYRNLAATHSFSQALRQAQIAFLDSSTIRYKHPYYWAPFFILGGHTGQ